MADLADHAFTCARCRRPGALYDAEFSRPEGRICWVCADAEHDPEERDDVEYWSEMKARSNEVPPQLPNCECGKAHWRVRGNVEKWVDLDADIEELDGGATDGVDNDLECQECGNSINISDQPQDVQNAIYKRLDGGE